MIRAVVLWPDPVLRRVAAPVIRFDDRLAALAQDMLDTIYAAPGRGLAAPQVGLSLRMFVTDESWKEGAPAPRVFVNPEVMRVSSDRSVNDEGCLSLPGFTLAIDRPAEVTLRWQDLSGTVHQETLTGFQSICAQHEYDHVDGILTLDRAAPGQLETVAQALTKLKGAA